MLTVNESDVTTDVDLCAIMSSVLAAISWPPELTTLSHHTMNEMRTAVRLQIFTRVCFARLENGVRRRLVARMGEFNNKLGLSARAISSRSITTHALPWYAPSAEYVLRVRVCVVPLCFEIERGLDGRGS